MRALAIKVFALIVVMAGLAMTTTAARAATSADATIFNKATLTYSGGTVEAGVAVKIALVGAAPTLSDPGDTSVTSGDTIEILYSVYSNANGQDNYNLSAPSVDTQNNTGTLGAPSITFYEGASGSTTITDIDLGAAITAASNTVANQILIPAGSEVNLTDGAYLNIPGFGVYKINGITPGTVPDINNAETFTAIDLDTTTDLPGDSLVTGADFNIGDIGAAVQVGEFKHFRVEVTGGTFTGDSTQGTHTITVTLDPDNGDVNGTNEIAVTVDAATVFFTKRVAQVTGATAGVGGTVGAYSTTPTWDVASGDVLQYEITAGPTSGQPAITGAVIADDAPDYTTYVTDSLTLNSVQVGCASGCPLASDGGTLPLESGTFQVNSQGGPSDDGTGNDDVGKLGVIDAGNQATVTFRVIVD